jgi:hypothetical protein
MVRYYKTTGIYDKANLLRLEVKYNKDRGGYIAQIDPSFKEAHSWGIIYDREYYQHYGTLIELLVNCSRRSEKRYKEACAMCDKMICKLLADYVYYAEKKGGRHIEIIGELEE